MGTHQGFLACRDGPSAPNVQDQKTCICNQGAPCAGVSYQWVCIVSGHAPAWASSGKEVVLPGQTASELKSCPKREPCHQGGLASTPPSGRLGANVLTALGVSLLICKVSLQNS